MYLPQLLNQDLRAIRPGCRFIDRAEMARALLGEINGKTFRAYPSPIVVLHLRDLKQLLECLACENQIAAVEGVLGAFKQRGEWFHIIGVRSERILFSLFAPALFDAFVFGILHLGFEFLHQLVNFVQQFVADALVC